MGYATTEEEANSVTVAQTTNRVRANTVDYDEEEKEQSMKVSVAVGLKIGSLLIR
jgi:ElaB/YqjD/DUF883 family membrane-anchored ribosome-binding protein